MGKKLKNLLKIGLVGLSSMLPAKKAHGQIRGDISTDFTNSYLTNGFSFNNYPTVFINGNIGVNSGNYSLTLTGIHSRDIRNHFNGKTSWIEKTGMMDISRNLGIGTLSFGGYVTFLPEDVFGIDYVTGVSGSFTTSSNPSFRAYLERGMHNLTGWLGKVSVSASENVLSRPVNANLTMGAMDSYFIDKRGLHFMRLGLNTPAYSSGNFSVTAGANYQMGIGENSVSGLAAKLTARANF